MVKFKSKERKNRAVLLSSIATSIALMSLFLIVALLVNTYAEKATYTMVDIIAGCTFVLFVTMIISLSLWPRVMDRLESREITKTVR